jgi:hypothetical protein
LARFRPQWYTPGGRIDLVEPVRQIVVPSVSTVTFGLSASGAP